MPWEEAGKERLEKEEGSGDEEEVKDGRKGRRTSKALLSTRAPASIAAAAAELGSGDGDDGHGRGK